MNLQFLYGKQKLNIETPSGINVDTITYDELPVEDPARCIRNALDHPIGSLPLKQIALGRKNAVILISDVSRLCPSYLFLEPLLNELNAGGIADSDIEIVVALGMHRKQTEAELVGLTGEPVYGRVRVSNHSALPEDCVRLGVTRQGTPVEINRSVAAADLRIATGNIEPHRLVGVSGGVKALLPGVASQTCIEHNHALSQHHKASVGDPDNAVHRDLEEAQRIVPIDFLFNVIVNHRRELISAVAGDVIQAHRAGLEKARKHFIVPFSHHYDIVLASAGGHPKDMQLYQAVKSIVNAAQLVRPGGTLLMAAQCEEIYGNGLFQYWTETICDRERIVDMLSRQFVLGPHKIEHIYHVLEKCSVILFSDVPPPIVELLGFVPADDLQGKVHELLRDSAGGTAVFMPHASITFPLLKLN